MSKSLKNFNPHGDSHIENDDSFIRRNNGAPKTPTLVPAKESRDSREPSKLLSHARPPTSEHAQKKRDNLSKIEDVKVEIRGDELLIFNTREELDNVPIDSLKASTIHDISKNIIDKLNLDTIDHDEQLLLGSKLSSALRFVEVATKDQKKIVEKAERETRENEATYPPNDTMFEVVSNCEEDLLMIQIDQFQSIYKKEYLDKVLGDTWRDEGMHQMSLRHEAELNQLKKMHTEQMQELIDEMRRRKHRVKRIEQRMKHVGHIKKEYHEQESTSQLMEFESNSMRSKDHSFRGLFSNHDHLTDNLSRINVPAAGHRDNEFNHRDEHDLIAIPLFSDCQKTYPIIPTLILPTENKSEQLRQESMENGIYLEDKRHSDNVDAKTQQTPTDKFNEHVNSASFVISPIHQSVVNEQDNTTKDYTLKGSSKNLIGRGILLPLHQVSKEDCSNQGRSGPLQNGRPLTQRTCEDRLMNDCKGNKYKGSSEEVYSLNNLSPPQTPLNFTFDNLFIMIEKKNILDSPLRSNMEDEKDREADILLLQQALSALFPEADVFANGKFARFTERIVARFQESKGIKADGVVDQATWSALRESILQLRDKRLEEKFKSCAMDTCKRLTIDSRSKLKESGSLNLKSFEQELFQSLPQGSKHN